MGGEIKTLKKRKPPRLLCFHIGLGGFGAVQNCQEAHLNPELNRRQSHEQIVNLLARRNIGTGHSLVRNGNLAVEYLAITS